MAPRQNSPTQTQPTQPTSAPLDRIERSPQQIAQQIFEEVSPYSMAQMAYWSTYQGNQNIYTRQAIVDVAQLLVQDYANMYATNLAALDIDPNNVTHQSFAKGLEKLSNQSLQKLADLVIEDDHMRTLLHAALAKDPISGGEQTRIELARDIVKRINQEEVLFALASVLAEDQGIDAHYRSALQATITRAVGHEAELLTLSLQEQERETTEDSQQTETNTAQPFYVALASAAQNEKNFINDIHKVHDVVAEIASCFQKLERDVRAGHAALELDTSEDLIALEMNKLDQKTAELISAHLGNNPDAALNAQRCINELRGRLIDDLRLRERSKLNLEAARVG